MQHRRFELLRFALVGVPLAVATIVALLWPGPLALDDRIPLVLVFGIPAAVFADWIRRELE